MSDEQEKKPATTGYVIDLDILRPQKKLIRLANRTIDVSMVPCGITFEVDKLVRELTAIDQSKIQSGGEETRQALDITIKLCSVFASIHNLEMDEKWFRENVDVLQINKMAEVIKDALVRSYEGVKEYGKN